MGNFIDRTGERHGRLTVVRRGPNRVSSTGHQSTMWTCRCDCGNVKDIGAIEIRVGKTKSCGCLHKEGVSKMMKRHGLSYSPTYYSWQSMKRRCDNPKEACYNQYGGAGITYCSEWSSFDNFLRDMGERPSGTSLDRIDNLKGYSKDNCRWATRVAQNTNRTHIVLFDYEGKKLTLSEIARREGLKDNTLRWQVNLGRPLHEAIRVAHLPLSERRRVAKP